MSGPGGRELIYLVAVPVALPGPPRGLAPSRELNSLLARGRKAFYETEPDLEEEIKEGHVGPGMELLEGRVLFMERPGGPGPARRGSALCLFRYDASRPAPRRRTFLQDDAERALERTLGPVKAGWGRALIVTCAVGLSRAEAMEAGLLALMESEDLELLEVELDRSGSREEVLRRRYTCLLYTSPSPRDRG